MSRLRCALCRTIQEAEKDGACLGCDAPLADALALTPLAAPGLRSAAAQIPRDQAATRILMFVFGVLSAVGVLGVRFIPGQEAACGWILFTVPAVAIFLFIPVARLILKLDVHVLLKALVLLVILACAAVGAFFLVFAVCVTREDVRF